MRISDWSSDVCSSDLSERSLYMDGDVFEALVFLVGPFTLKAPVTLEGAAVVHLAEELDEAARQVSHADIPKALWPYTAGYGYTQFNAVRDWPRERHAFTHMLREPVAWPLKAQDGGRPVTLRSMWNGRIASGDPVLPGRLYGNPTPEGTCDGTG